MVTIVNDTNNLKYVFLGDGNDISYPVAVFISQCLSSLINTTTHKPSDFNHLDDWVDSLDFIKDSFDNYISFVESGEGDKEIIQADLEESFQLLGEYFFYLKERINKCYDQWRF